MTDKEFQKLRDDVCDIKTAIVGDPKLGHLGLVKQVQYLQRWKKSLDLRIAAVTGFVTGAGFIIKYLLTGSLCLALVLTSGCSLTRSARTQTAEAVTARHASTIEKSVEGLQVPNVTVSGSSNVITISPAPVTTSTRIDDAANTKGDASGDFRSNFRASLSTYLALAAFALALGILLIAFVIWRRGSASGAAADAALATAIDHVQHGGQNVLALLEKNRGKLKGK